MEEQEKIGGRAYSNGILLMNSTHAVKAYYDKNDRLLVEVSRVKKSKYLKYIQKIPIIRGIISLLFAVIIFLKDSMKKPKKYWFIPLIIIIELIYLFLPSAVSDNTLDILILAYFLLPLILLFIFRKTIKEVLKYHGAEHKVVHYFEGNCPQDISSCSRLHKRCGSNIVFYYLLISLVTFFIKIPFPVHPLLLEIIFLGLAYELIRYTPDSLLFLPYLFQRIATREPDERHLRAARTALAVLMQK